MESAHPAPEHFAQELGLPPYRPTAFPSLREASVGDSAVPRLELVEWAERYGVVAGITTRGGRGAGAGADTRAFSLGLWSEDNVGQVMTRWRAFRAAFGRAFPMTITSNQVHGTLVEWQEAALDGWLILDGVDGHATAQPGILLTITVADCIPVYLAVPRKGAMALLHAGWRGTVGRVLERGVEILKRQAFAKAADIVMHCGVGICGACYEVGPEVAVQFSGTIEQGPRSLDLREVLARQAAELGIPDVSISPWCTAHDRERFLSHRASGGREGRMVAYLGQPAA